MIDPTRLDATSLRSFTTDMIDGEYFDDEPLELEGVVIGSADSAVLTDVPLALQGCVIAGCDLSLLSFRGVKHSRFEACKLRGTRFSKHVTNTLFSQCQLNECRFRMMQLKQVAFAESQVIECDFYGSTLDTIDFTASAFEGVGFDACTVEGIDLTGAISLLIGDPRTLAGAAVCETQLPAIAQRLAVLSGINVRDC